jgi:hypothetical protein
LAARANLVLDKVHDRFPKSLVTIAQSLGNRIPTEILQHASLASTPHGFSTIVLLSRSSSVCANSSALFFSTTKPVTPSMTVSGTEPDPLITTGNPAAIAFTGGRPKPSSHRREHKDVGVTIGIY